MDTSEVRTMEDEIKLRFTYHAPKPGQPEKYTKLRDKALELALMIKNVCPDSREQQLAFTHLDEVIMWANASIARRS